MGREEDYKVLELLIDSDDFVLHKHCADKSLGYVNSLKNFMIITYEQVKEMKEGIKKIIQDSANGDLTKEKDTMNGLYAEMFKIEHKVTVLNEIIDFRKLSNT